MLYVTRYTTHYNLIKNPNMNYLKCKAHTKAYAKLSTLDFEIARLTHNLETGLTCGVTSKEYLSVLEGTKTEREVWSYILELIEKTNKDD